MNVDPGPISMIDGVNGLCVHRGGIIKWQRLPDSLTNDRAAALCHAVSQAFAAYARAGRVIREAYFEFAGQSILAVARRPDDHGAGPDSFLTFLLRDRSAVPAAVRAAAGYFASGPA